MTTDRSHALDHIVVVLTTKPDEVAAVQKERFMKVWDGTSQNQ